MNGKLNLLAAVLIAVAITTSSTLLQGQTTIWVGGGGNNLFSNGLNWSNECAWSIRHGPVPGKYSASFSY